MNRRAEQSPRTVLEALIRGRNQTWSELAGEYQTVAHRLGEDSTITDRQLRRLASGEQSHSNPVTRRVLEALFDHPFAELVQPPGQPVVGTAAGGVRAPSAEEEVAIAASESARFGQLAEQTNVGPHTLGQFEADLRRIVRTYPNRPVYPMFVELRELRDRSFELLEGRQRPDQSRDLYLVAGTLCGVLANASFDLGWMDAAETQARTAFLCAELAGHNGLRAWIRGTQSLIAYWDDRPRAAVDLAVDGWRYVPEAGTARVRLAAIEARARGRMRDASGTDSALHRATQAREDVVVPDDPGGMMAFPEAKQLFYAATARLWLGGATAYRQAEYDATESVAAYERAPVEQRRIGELCLARLDLAAARLAGQSLDGAAEQIEDVLAISARRRTDSVARRLTQVAVALDHGPHRDSALAQNLHSQIGTYLRSPAPAAGTSQ